jgi:hypothetical protein
MTRLFTDGAEWRDWLFWDEIIHEDKDIVAGPISPWCYHQWHTDGVGMLKWFAPLSEFYMRFRIKNSDWGESVPGENRNPDFYSDGNSVLFLCSNPMQLRTPAGILATSSYNLENNVWYLFEIYVKIDDSNGRVIAKVNDFPHIDFTGDTKYLSYSTFNKVGFGTGGAVGGDNQCWWDDLAMNDTSGSVDNSWCRNGVVELLMPNFDGDTLEWTPITSGSHFADVDEIPNDGDTTYIQTLSTATKRDMLHLFPFNDYDKVVTRIFPEARIKDVNNGLVQVKFGVKTGGNVYLSSAKTLTDAYTSKRGEDLLANPTSGSVWDKTALDALQVVAEVQY